MPLPKGANLPVAASGLIGLCVLGAVIYVTNGVLAQHAAPWQAACAVLFGLTELALWTWGFALSFQALSRFAREASAIPQAAAKLVELARGAEAHLTDDSTAGPNPLSPATPGLNSRVAHAWKALRRGVPLQASVQHADRVPDSAEREIGMVRDVALAIGIAGAFVTVLISLGGAQGLSASALFALSSPGLTIGLAAAIANIGLNVSRRAVLDEHARLTAQVDDAISDHFLSNLPKALASPQDRLAAASEQLAQDTREILEYSFEKHNAATQKMLTAQAAQSDSLLREHALLIGQALTKQIQLPMQQLAASGEALVQQTAAVADAVEDIKAANAQILASHRSFLNDFLEVTRQANHVMMVEMQEATASQIQEHGTAAAAHLVTFREQFSALMAENEKTHNRLTEAALVSLAGVVDNRVATVDQQFAATLGRLQEQLPDHLRIGIKDALGETVAVLSALREQAALLANTIAQVSANADRQLLAYERWQERANASQSRLEQLVAGVKPPNESAIR